METTGYVVIFGVLAVVVGLIVGSFFVQGGWGTFMIVAGCLLGFVWLVGMFQLGSAMNSDV